MGVEENIDCFLCMHTPCICTGEEQEEFYRQQELLAEQDYVENYLNR